MHDLQRSVNRERKDLLTRLEGDLESSGNDGSFVRLEDVKTPSETDCPSRRRFPTGAAYAVVPASLSLSLDADALCAGGFSFGDAIETAVADMVGSVSAAVVRSDWVW